LSKDVEGWVIYKCQDLKTKFDVKCIKNIVMRANSWKIYIYL